MNTERINAQKEYDVALKNWRKSVCDDVITLEEFKKLDSILTEKRNALVNCEILYPTIAESKKEANRVYWSNRGFSK